MMSFEPKKRLKFDNEEKDTAPVGIEVSPDRIDDKKFERIFGRTMEDVIALETTS